MKDTNNLQKKAKLLKMSFQEKLHSDFLTHLVSHLNSLKKSQMKEVMKLTKLAMKKRSKLTKNFLVQLQLEHSKGVWLIHLMKQQNFTQQLT